MGGSVVLTPQAVIWLQDWGEDMEEENGEDDPCIDDGEVAIDALPLPGTLPSQASLPSPTVEMRQLQEATEGVDDEGLEETGPVKLEAVSPLPMRPPPPLLKLKAFDPSQADTLIMPPSPPTCVGILEDSQPVDWPKGSLFGSPLTEPKPKPPAVQSQLPTMSVETLDSEIERLESLIRISHQCFNLFIQGFFLVPLHMNCLRKLLSQRQLPVDQAFL